MFNSTIQKNLIANFAGSFWQALMGLAFIPLYIKFMGIESYGLIGIFATLQMMFGLLDLGLGSTLTREMARLSVLPGKEQEMRNLVRTLEMLYWLIAVFVGLAVILLTPMIAHNWIRAGDFPRKIIEQALLIMGFAMVFQMPVGFYSGGLLGLQKQVMLNIINAGMSTLRSAGAVLIVWLVSPTIQSFLLWHVFISIIHAFLLALLLWRSLPQSARRAAFQKQLLTGVWRFSAGMAGVSVLSVILTQLDKILLSKMLSLELFGYYMLASTIAMSLGRLFTPFFFSIYPRFTQLVSTDDKEKLKHVYHAACQFMAVLILPAASVIALFSHEIILLWTQNQVTADQTYVLVRILICGTALNGLMNSPYALQLASGWTYLSVMKNLIAVVLLVPLIFYLTKQYGGTGAASAWFLLNMGYVLFEIPIMHCRLLPLEMWHWYWQDVIVPLAAALSTAALGRLLFHGAASSWFIVLQLVAISILTLAITMLSVSTVRTFIRARYYTRKVTLV